jgi:hypothetical protein
MKPLLCVPALLLLLAQAGQPAPRIRLAGVSVGAGYTNFGGRYWGSWYDPWYGSPWFYPPYFHPAFLGGFARGPAMGEIKLQSEERDAEVFLDGAYAGTVRERRSMWLEPGAYNLEVRAANRRPYARRVYVLSGRTLRISARPDGEKK